MGSYLSSWVSNTPQFELLDEKRVASGSMKEAAELRKFIDSASLGDVESMNTASKVTWQLVRSLPPNHRFRCIYLHYLGSAFLRRAVAGRFTELSLAIETFRIVAHLASNGDQNGAIYVHSLARALSIRFEHTTQIEDLNEVVQIIDDSTYAIRDHPDFPLCLGLLGQALRERFNQTGSTKDLSRAVEVYTESVATNTPDRGRPIRLHNLGTVLFTQHEWLNAHDSTILDKAILMHQKALKELPQSDPNRYAFENNLAVVFLRRYSVTGNMDDLEAAITLNGNVLQSTVETHEQRGKFHATRCDALRLLYIHTRSETYLNDAIVEGAKAICGKFSSPSRGDDACMLANALVQRFLALGDLSDSNRAVSAYESAIALIPANSPRRAMYLDYLGRILQQRSSRWHLQGELDKAIEMHSETIKSVPRAHPKRDSYLYGLGTAYKLRYERNNSDKDAKAAKRTILDSANSPDSDHQMMCFNQLGNLFLVQFIRNKKLEDLIQAIAASEKAARAPNHQPIQKAQYLFNLGMVYIHGATYLMSKEYEDKALSAFEASSHIPSAPPAVRINAMANAAFVFKKRDASKEYQLLKGAVELLPNVAPNTMSRFRQQFEISQFPGLATAAAAASLATENNLFEAIRLLELGKGILTAQFLDTRADIKELQEMHPELANRYIQLRDIVDSDPTQNAWNEDEWAVNAKRQYEASTQFAEVIQRIREEANFHRFLMEPSERDVTALASQGPVVIFNVSDLRSDAILVTQQGVVCQPLPMLKVSDLRQKAIDMRKSLDWVKVSSYTKAMRVMKKVLEWLWDVAVGPVLSRLGLDQPPKENKWPRIWWVANGLLNTLPLHAAGYHEHGSTKNSMDCVISSYVPTLRSLDHARRKASLISSQDNDVTTILVAGMPTTPKMKNLSCVEEETKCVAEALPDFVNKCILLSCTRDEVLYKLRTASMVHFACHGESNLEPSESKLFLEDWERSPFTVADITALRLERGRLAYLNICHAASNSVLRLLDEHIHLAGACMLAGFPHVIGTLWRVDDKHSADVAISVYNGIKSTGTSLHFHDSAESLHNAVRRLREETRHVEGFSCEFSDDPLKWAPYIHLGA